MFITPLGASISLLNGNVLIYFRNSFTVVQTDRHMNFHVNLFGFYFGFGVFYNFLGSHVLHSLDTRKNPLQMKWGLIWSNHPSNNPFICRQSLHPSICLSIQPTIYPLDVYYEDIRYWFFVLCRSICPSVCRLVGPLLNNIKNKPNRTEPKWSELKYSRVVTGAMETLWNIEKVIIKLNLQNEKLELRKNPQRKNEKIKFNEMDFHRILIITSLQLTHFTERKYIIKCHGRGKKTVDEGSIIEHRQHHLESCMIQYMAPKHAEVFLSSGDGITYHLCMSCKYFLGVIMV